MSQIPHASISAPNTTRRVLECARTPAALYLPFSRYKPETKQDKAKRLKSVAETVAAGKKADAGKKVQFPLASRRGCSAMRPPTPSCPPSAARILTPPLTQPIVLKFGINHITDLVENRTAKLVRSVASAIFLHQSNSHHFATFRTSQFLSAYLSVALSSSLLLTFCNRIIASLRLRTSQTALYLRTLTITSHFYVDRQLFV